MNKSSLKVRNTGFMDHYSEKDIKDAMEVASYWLTKKLKGKTDHGPFCDAVLGEPARLYFPIRAMEALMSGAWKLKPGMKLSTQLIRIMKSDIGHSLRDWNSKGEMETVTWNDEMQHPSGQLKTVIEIEEERADSDRKRELAYQIALKVAEGNDELMRYVQLMREFNDYREIALKMKLRKSEVLHIEASLLLLVRKHRNYGPA
ncbi:MAG: hypothetical protein IKO33_00500 [Bacteroidaceae bacterium]|nr:hypothetical protein [Bacteroidaceae bacterium]